MLIRIGLIDNFELRIGINSLAIENMYNEITYGKDPLELGFKIQIVDTPDHFILWHPGVAFIGFSVLPIGSNDFTEHTFQPGGKLIFAWPLTDF